MTKGNVPARSITREEARHLTDEIKADTEAFLEDIAPKLARMYAEQAWYALDYETWDEYCQAEFGSIRLPRGNRSATVLFLRDEGLSIRAISSALGLGRGTVQREIEAGVPDGTPDTPDLAPKVTIGLDGKNYPASSPTPPKSSEPEPVTITIAESEPTPPSEPVTIMIAEPVEPKVVAPPRTPNRRSIVDTAVDLGHDLRKVFDRVVQLTADDRLDDNRDGVKGQLGHYLGQMIESCQELGLRIDPPTEPTPVPQPMPQPEPTPAQARSQLDATTAELTERIRVELWRSAATNWYIHAHGDHPFAPAFGGEDELIAAMVYVWQQAIDAGHAQPVTECPGSGFRAPDSPWPGLGLNDDSEFWTVPWSGLGDDIDRLVGKARRLERERVRYDVYAKVAKALNNQIDKLFDSDGDWASDDAQVKLPNITGIVAHRSTVFDDLVTKVDRNAPPDFRDWPLPSGA